MAKETTISTSLDLSNYTDDKAHEIIRKLSFEGDATTIGNIPFGILEVIHHALVEFDNTLWDRVLNPALVNNYLYTKWLIDTIYRGKVYSVEDGIESELVWDDHQDVIVKNPIDGKYALVWNLKPNIRLMAYQLEYISLFEGNGKLPHNASMELWIISKEIKAIEHIREEINHDILDTYEPCNGYPVIYYDEWTDHNYLETHHSMADLENFRRTYNTWTPSKLVEDEQYEEN